MSMHEAADVCTGSRGRDTFIIIAVVTSADNTE
jgi:hypothetical protein